MAGIISRLYTSVFRRTSTFALTIIAGAFFFERAVDVGGDYIFDKVNEGKLWKDIKHKYVKE
ncbi:Cytochrome b-c1 complex subunit 9, partial [Stegodyphus mimosarum]